MKSKNGAVAFLAVFLAGVLLQAQNRNGGSIVWSRTNGREELRIPTNGDQAPSTLFNGTILATGNAANILSRRQAPEPATPPPDAAPARVTQTMIYDNENAYLGAASQIADGAFITAAHVFDQLEEASLLALLRRLNIPSSSAELYQFTYQSQPLDAVLILDKSRTSRDGALVALRSLSGPSENQSGDRFSLVHYTQMDGQLVEQQSGGTLSVSRDHNLLYLNNSPEARLTWGSSGAMVFSQSAGSPQWRFGGLVQCVVHDEIASGRGGEEVSYFRALSTHLLTSAQLEPVTVQQLKAHRAHYNLETCGPVDAKKGGGG